MIFRTLLVFLFSLSLTAASFSVNLADEADWDKVVQDQNAADAGLALALNSTRSDTQSQALLTLMKILTPESLNVLISSSDKIKSENFDAYCLALGQMYHVKYATVGRNVVPGSMEAALAILERALVEKNNVATCFEAYAKISPRSLDSQMETLFKTIDFTSLSEKDVARVAMAIYFHRQNTYNPEAPTDRYFMNAEFAAYFRSINFGSSMSAESRQAFARVAYLANDEMVYSDYSKLLNDSDFTTRYLAVDLVNFVDKKNPEALMSALKDSDYRITVRALEALRTLKLSEGLWAKNPELLSHPRRQVRRAMLQAVSDQLTVDDIKKLLKDESLAVRQIAAQEFTTRSEDRSVFALEVFAGNDLALKKGVIDASTSLGEQRVAILEKAMVDSDFFAKSYALTHIQENGIEALYPQVVELLTGATFEERYEAAAVLLKWQAYPNRATLLESVYAASLAPMFFYLRELVVGQLTDSKNAADHQLLLKLLPLEQNWKLANQIGQALQKFGLAEYTLRLPKWTDSAGSKYRVTERRPLIEMQTTKGTMVFALFNDVAPLHVSEVLWGIEQGFWSKNFFHRVIDNFVAQSYRPITVASGANADARAEIIGLKQERGTIAMPRSDYMHSGDGGGFYINLITNWNLNYNYTVFGKLIMGDSVLDELEIGDQVLNVRRIK